MENNYIKIFNKVEQTLRQNSGLSDQQFADKYSNFRNLTFRNRTDNEYFDIIKLIIFYSGFKAETVTNKLDIINKHLPDYKTVSLFGDIELTAMLSDDEMIKNRSKILATITNAKTLKSLVEQYGSVSFPKIRTIC